MPIRNGQKFLKCKAQHSSSLCNKNVTDNYPQFVSEHFKKFCTDKGIEHTTTTANIRRSNGQAERFVQSLIQGLLELAKDTRQQSSAEISYFL